MVVAHANDGVLALAAQPEMPVVHQEFRAVFLGRDGVRIRLGDALDHLQIFHIHLEAAGSARIGANFSGDNDRRFLRQIANVLKQLFRQRVLHRHALHQSGSIAQQREHNLAGLADVVKPAGNFDRLPFMADGLENGNSSGHFRHFPNGRTPAAPLRAGWRYPGSLSAPAAADTGFGASAACPWRAPSR